MTVENELARLTKSTYPPAQLLQRPLPEGVDPTHLELYLSQQHFQVSFVRCTLNCMEQKKCIKQIDYNLQKICI